MSEAFWVPTDPHRDRNVLFLFRCNLMPLALLEMALLGKRRGGRGEHFAL